MRSLVVFRHSIWIIGYWWCEIHFYGQVSDDGKWIKHLNKIEKNNEIFINITSLCQTVFSLFLFEVNSIFIRILPYLVGNQLNSFKLIDFAIRTNQQMPFWIWIRRRIECIGVIVQQSTMTWVFYILIKNIFFRNKNQILFCWVI